MERATIVLCLADSGAAVAMDYLGAMSEANCREISGRLTDAKSSKRLHRNSVPEQSDQDIKSPREGCTPSTQGLFGYQPSQLCLAKQTKGLFASNIGKQARVPALLQAKRR